MADSYKIKCIPPDTAWKKSCQLDSKVEDLLIELGIFRGDLLSTDDKDIKEIDPSIIKKPFKKFLKMFLKSVLPLQIRAIYWNQNVLLVYMKNVSIIEATAS